MTFGAMRRGGLGPLFLLASGLALLASGLGAAAQDCGEGPSACQGRIVDSACLDALGAGAAALAPTGCAAQFQAYQSCLRDFAERCASGGAEDDFIGALDGRYQQEGGYNLAEADVAASEMTFLAGNCAFTVDLRQQKGGWEGTLKSRDGVCSFLKGLEPGVELIRVIPKPRALANSGRVLKFYLETRAFELQDFAGDYALK